MSNECAAGNIFDINQFTKPQEQKPDKFDPPGLPALHLLFDFHGIYKIYQDGEMYYAIAMACVYALPGCLGNMPSLHDLSQVNRHSSSRDHLLAVDLARWTVQWQGARQVDFVWSFLSHFPLDLVINNGFERIECNLKLSSGTLFMLAEAERILIGIRLRRKL